MSVIYEQIITDNVIERLTTRAAAKFHETEVFAAGIVEYLIIRNRTIHFNGAAVDLIIVTVSPAVMDLVMGDGIIGAADHDAHGAEVVPRLIRRVDDHAQVADIAIGDGIITTTADTYARAQARYLTIFDNVM